MPPIALVAAGALAITALSAALAAVLDASAWAVWAVFSAGGALTAAAVGVTAWADALPSTEDGPDGAARSTEAQHRLLDDVRHELKTPITIVRGHLEVMDADDPEDVRTIRDIGLSELDRMTRLLGDIDLLASVEADGFTMGEVDLTVLTDRVADLVGAIGGHPWSVEQTAAGIIRGDADRLVQAWVQLADNAAKYTPAGSAISIGSARHAAGAQLWVRDHGPGIPAAMRHRVFRRFDRGAGSRAAGGSGLGLAIVDAIAKAHGGHCSVADTPGGGATITLEIPFGTAADLPTPVRAGAVLDQREAIE